MACHGCSRASLASPDYRSGPGRVVSTVWTICAPTPAASMAAFLNARSAASRSVPVMPHIPTKSYPGKTAAETGNSWLKTGCGYARSAKRQLSGPFPQGRQRSEGEDRGMSEDLQRPGSWFKVDGRMEWFAYIDLAKPIVALVRAVTRHETRLREPLERRRVARRSGQSPRQRAGE